MMEAAREVEDLATKVIGAAIEVHRYLGPGFSETSYEEALAIELALRGIAFRRQHEVDIEYKGHAVTTHRLDLLVGGVLVVELKAIDRIGPVHVRQTLSYLTACGLELGLVFNFNVPSLNEGGIRRVIRSNYPE